MNLTEFFDSLKNNVYYKKKNNKYYLFGKEEELTYIYFNLYTDKKGIKFIKIGTTNNPTRRKRENDKLYSKDSTILCRVKIPFAKEIEHHIHTVYLDKKYRAEQIFDLDEKEGKRKYIKLDNKETYMYDEIKSKVDKIISEVKKIEYIDDIKNLTADVLMKHLMPESKLDKYIDPEFKEEDTYDYDELIKGNLNQYGKYRVSSKSFQMINDLRSKKIDNDREYGFIKDMCSLVSKNKSLTKNQIHWLNILTEKYLVVN
jgi:hypothetical protein